MIEVDGNHFDCIETAQEWARDLAAYKAKHTPPPPGLSFDALHKMWIEDDSHGDDRDDWESDIHFEVVSEPLYERLSAAPIITKADALAALTFLLNDECGGGERAKDIATALAGFIERSA